MKFKQLRTGIFALLSSHLVLAFAEKVTVKITPDPKACTVVHLPSWTVPKLPSTWMAGSWPYESVCDFRFRSSNDGVLVGVFCQKASGEEQIYSPDKYAISVKNGTVRKASDSEWDQATSYPNFRISAQNFGMILLE